MRSETQTGLCLLKVSQIAMHIGEENCLKTAKSWVVSLLLRTLKTENVTKITHTRKYLLLKD